ncbi:MAG TPA: 2TM domain-containing protein [Gaiellaceae bacterium]|nr:2TM domain-containing protein [Gaiellaceae bacterium]
MLTADEYRQAEFGYTLEEARRGFKIHATVYAIVNTGLIVLNAVLWTYTDGDFPWAIFPLVCWGIGLTFHYVYGLRRAGDQLRARQRNIETYAQRPKKLVR